MDSAECNNENTPKQSLTLNEKRKPLESPFSAFSPAQRLAKKKGRILTEPGDSNLDSSNMDDSILRTENSDSFELPTTFKPKVLFANGDIDEEASSDQLAAVLNQSLDDPTQSDGDRTFSAETRPFVPSSVDPNLDETHLDMSMNQTFSELVKPIIPSSVDPNLDETLAEMTMNETFSNVVRPVVPSEVDPNMDETLAETTINQTQQSLGDESIYVGKEDDLAEDENTTLEAQKEESIVAASTENGGMSLFEEMNTLELTVPVDLTVTEEEEEEKSAVEASQEHSTMQGEGEGEGGGMSLFDELNTQSSNDWMEDGKGQMIDDIDLMVGETSLKDEMNEMPSDSPLDESIVSTITAVGITTRDANRQYYNDIKQRISSIAQTPQVDKEKETDGRDTTPTQSNMLMGSPVSASYGYSMSNHTMVGSPSPSRNNRFATMNDSHISFILHEAEATSSVYSELKKDMAILQEELTQSRELTEKVEKERDNARKEVEDYVFMMETTKKRMISEKTTLTKQIYDLEGELMEARRMSSVVEEEGRKVEEMEKMKMELEEKMKSLEEDMKEESDKYEKEKERLSVRVEEMEKQIDDERKKANEEMERRVGECRMEMERKMEEILVQKNDLISRLEQMDCESGDKEYSNEEMERRLEGEKAMMETVLNEVNKEKREIEEELGRMKMENEEVRRGKIEIEEQMERVKMDKEETDRKMMEVTDEFNGMKKSMDDLKKAALEDSKISHELSTEVEQLKRMNGEMKGTIEEKDKEIESLRTSLSNSSVDEGRVSEMERRVEGLEKEKVELENNMKNMQAERELAGKMESRMEEMMNGLMQKTNEQFKETAALNAQIVELRKKVMETEMEMKAIAKELESSEAMKKGMETEMERMKEEKESMETAFNSLKKEYEDVIRKHTEENEKIKVMEEMKDTMSRRIVEIEEEKEKEVKKNMEEIVRIKVQMEELEQGKTEMEEELERKKEEMEHMKRIMEMEKVKSENASVSEETMREMEENRKKLMNVESSLAVMMKEKEEAERRAKEDKEEMEKMMENMQRVNEEMREKMESMKKEYNIEKETLTRQVEDIVKNVKVELENEKNAKEAISVRLMESENEKMEALKNVDSERERIDVLSEMVRQLEREVETKNATTPSIALSTVHSNGMDDEEKKRLEEELKEERHKVNRLEKELKRLEDACDEFDDIENELKQALFEKQQKIDVLEGKAQGGPSLLDALKPTNMEIKAMNETVVDPVQSIPVREGAGKEEKNEKEKEDEEMKEEYGTPAGSVYDEEEGTKIMEGEATLGVTKYDETRGGMEDDDEEEEDYEKANVTRTNASCRQS